MKLVHICESCGKTETLTPEEAFEQGWDYPPNMGVFGILSPRTCGDCGIDKTLWWRITVDKKKPTDFTEDELNFVERVLGEPVSITPSEEP